MSQMTRLDYERILEKLETAREMLEIVESKIEDSSTIADRCLLRLDIEKTLKDTEGEQ